MHMRGGPPNRHPHVRLIMANVKLENMKKIYPISNADKKASKRKNRKNKIKELKPNNLQITKEGVVAVQTFDLDIADKEFIVLVGPSGCGKSTTLRMIAGLEEISGGKLFIGDKLMNDVAPKDRDIAMVFQSYALYPHMTVFENMAFALKLRKISKVEIERRVHEAAEILGITELLERKPKALSGGQRQRVAIGRAIVREPQVFLMDEPLSNLDAKLRNQMRAELIKLRKRINTTFIYVTHDQTEAMTLGDRIVVMKDGYIQQIGTPQEVFRHPANLFVATFIGTPQMNLFDASIQKEKENYLLQIGTYTFPVSGTLEKVLKANEQETGDITLGIRPEHIMLAPEVRKDTVPATVDVSEMMGSEVHIHATAMGRDCVVRIALTDLSGKYADGFKSGDRIQITFDTKHVHLFDVNTNKNIISR